MVWLPRHCLCLKGFEAWKKEGGWQVCPQVWMGLESRGPTPAKSRFLLVLDVCLFYMISLGVSRLKVVPGDPSPPWATVQCCSQAERRRELVKRGSWDTPPQPADKTPDCCSSPEAIFLSQMGKGRGCGAFYHLFPPSPVVALALLMRWVERRDNSSVLLFNHNVTGFQGSWEIPSPGWWHIPGN